MNILFATSEAAPYVKTGGLADVSYALPTQLAQQPDTHVMVFLPLYRQIKHNKNIDLTYVTAFTVPLAWRSSYCGVFTVKQPQSNITYYFIDNDYYFGNRPSIYGDYDDMERFAFFSKAVLQTVVACGLAPDVIHANDWQTALIPVFLDAQYRGHEALAGVRTIFTIHNIEYQGRTGEHFVPDVLGLSDAWRAELSYDGQTNLMKGAIVRSSALTTVSRTYAQEILDPYFSHGLHHILREYSYKMTGIVNGIDLALYDPKRGDGGLIPFDGAHLAGKTQNKLALQRQLGLAEDPTVPLVAMVGRLVGHKGLDLVAFVAEELLQLPLQLVVLGTGEEHFEQMFTQLAQEYPTRVSANIAFDATLASKMYAAADLFLMPSKSEPCGLAQLIAMRYGTIPIVRQTGGLADTVLPVQEDGGGSGFTFYSYNAHDMLGAVARGVSLWQDRKKREQLMRHIMALDYSWEQPAQAYLALYRGNQ